MGLFSKRNARREDEDAEHSTPATPEGEPGVDRDWDRALDGPFDVHERPDAVGRVDFGALAIPAVNGMELRMDVEQDTRRVVGVTCGLGENKIQLQVFAAPRSTGIWDDIRRELVAGIEKAGGSVTIEKGVMGAELLTRLPARSESGETVYRPARFVGVDGPKWFLRAVVHGPASGDEAQLRTVIAFVRDVIVDRGDEPKPPRELLTLIPPKRPAEQSETSQ